MHAHSTSQPSRSPRTCLTLLGVLTSFILSGCASNSAAPSPQTPPPAATPQIVTLLVEGPALLLEGESASFTAVATYSDGSRQTASSPVWTAEGAATISGGGRAEGVQPGTATVTARVGDIRGTRELRVLPLMTGSWRGRWRHLGCRPVDPPQAGACSGITAGSTSAITIDLAQDNSRALTGTLNYAGVLMTVTGQVGDDGAVSLQGRRAPDYDIVSWSTSVVDRTLTGTFTLRQNRPSGVGVHLLDDELVDVRKAP